MSRTGTGRDGTLIKEQVGRRIGRGEGRILSPRSLVSSTLAKPVPQERLKFRDGVDLLDGGLVIVGEAAEVNPNRTGHAVVFAVFEDDVTRARIAVARLANRADVHHHLAFSQCVLVVNLLGGVELIPFRKNTWDMCMSLKTVALNQLKKPLHLPVIVNVFGKNIFAQWITW